MTRFIIRDETVHAAFDWLEENAQPAAVARAMRERREDERKSAKAMAYLHADGKNVAEKEANALLAPNYKAACEAYYQAVEEDETYRNRRSKAEAIIEAWRTVQSNLRAMGKVA